MNEKLMRTIAQMKAPKLSKALQAFLKNKGYGLIATKDYILAAGELPICLVAHMDTVGTQPPTDIYYDREAHIMWSPQLLGADDRAGIYAILQIINKGYRPSVIFTADEEQGGLGARALVEAIPDCPLDNLKAIFELDRCGMNDCVFYSCDNKDFVDFVETFGFEEAYGSFSDISVIAPAWGIAAVNLSVGYENEHQKIETLNTTWLDMTIKRVEQICEASNDMLSYVYIEAPKVFYGGRYGAGAGSYEKYGNWWFGNRSCIFCGRQMTEKEGHIVQEANYTYDVCNECYDSYYGMKTGEDSPPDG